MQKYRVLCPHCEASLLVTEDLLGQSGNCPGCHAEFLLPTEESFAKTAAELPSLQDEEHEEGTDKKGPESRPVAPPPFSTELGGTPQAGSAPPRVRQLKPVKIDGRPTLRMLAGLLKLVAVLQLLAGCLMLIILLIQAVKTPAAPQTVLMTVGLALFIGAGAVPMLAFSELILVFVAQEEMLRHIVNELRSRD